MNVKYLAQPDVQLGLVLPELLDSDPDSVVFVSAFVRLQTIVRIRDHVTHLRNNGCDIRFVLGIDLGGTSREVLEELLTAGCAKVEPHGDLLV